MADQSITQLAIEAVGEDQPCSDWKLKTQQHIARLGTGSERLAQVLLSAPVQSVMQRYEASDEAAIKAQTSYKSVLWTRAAVVIGLAAALAAIFILGNFLVAMLLGAFGGIVLVATLFLKRRSFEDWWKNRHEAELRRVRLFDLVFEDPKQAASQVGTGLDILPLQLEYFRRYQLDVQLRYYCERAEKLRRGNTGVIRGTLLIFVLSAIGYGAIALIGLVSIWEETSPNLPVWLEWAAQFDEVGMRGYMPVLLALAVLALAVFAVLTGIRMIGREARLAEEYAKMCERLQKFAAHDLALARAAAADGDAEAVDAFVRKVHALMVKEHVTTVIVFKGTDPDITALAPYRSHP